MKIHIKSIATIFMTWLFLWQGICAAETPEQLLSYHDSGQYAKEVAAVTEQAMNYMNMCLANKTYLPKLPAIILDIDETCLSNWRAIYASHFRFPSNWPKDKPLDQETVIPGTFALYQQALKNHVAVFFVTGRLERLRATTVENLRRAGYSQWAELILKPNGAHYSSNAPFKASARKKITESGYDIILNMGDQNSDLQGGYADRVFKLPNPYYFLP